MKRGMGFGAVLLGVVLAGTFALHIFAQKPETDYREMLSRTSIFSWEQEYMETEYEPQLELAMTSLGIETVYQEVSDGTDPKIVLSYLERRADKGQKVFYLAGASEWGLEEDAASMLAEVEKVKKWNRDAVKGRGFAGIVWDVEPYLLREWRKAPQEAMEQFVKNCEAAYQAAHKNRLAVILCIPNFYDLPEYNQALERLMKNGCDGIAVMNYLKADEAGQIAGEVELAQKYGKAVINITELQKPGYHELTEENTYYYDGLLAVEESWERLREAFDYDGLGFSWHYLKPILKLMGEETE